MTKGLTIAVENDVYAGLYSVIGRWRISRFLNDLARPHITGRDLAEGYRAMAVGWVENLAGDVANDAGRMNPDRTPPRGEVWWVAFDPPIAGEIRKRGPPLSLVTTLRTAS